MNQLHPKAIWLFFVHFLFTGLFIFFIFSFMSFGIIREAPTEVKVWKFTIWVIVAFILYVLFCYIWARLTYRFWRYQLTDSTLKIERGVIWKKYISIPFGRIQNVDIYRGVWARILGLSDLQVQTAGYAAAPGKHGGFRSEGRLPGLDPEVAEDLREQLIRRIKGGQGL